MVDDFSSAPKVQLPLRATEPLDGSSSSASHRAPDLVATILRATRSPVKTRYQNYSLPGLSANLFFTDFLLIVYLRPTKPSFVL